MTTDRSLILLAALTLSSNSLAMAESTGMDSDAETSAPPFARTEQREPCSNYTSLRRPHFGDLHVHTAWSFDASSQDTRNKPADAYRLRPGRSHGHPALRRE